MCDAAWARAPPHTCEARPCAAWVLPLSLPVRLPAPPRAALTAPPHHATPACLPQGDSAPRSAPNPLLGNVLVVLAQLLAATQFIVEEKFLAKYHAPVLLAGAPRWAVLCYAWDVLCCARGVRLRQAGQQLQR